MQVAVAVRGGDLARDGAMRKCPFANELLQDWFWADQCGSCSLYSSCGQN